jgi:hypothetical protein
VRLKRGIEGTLRKDDRSRPGPGTSTRSQAITGLDGVHSSVIAGATWEFAPAEQGRRRRLSKPALTARTENIARKVGKLFGLKNSLRILRRRADSVLFLRRAEKCRPGQFSNNDFDLFDGDTLVGQILWNPDAPPKRTWYWSVLLRSRPGRRDRGYAATREIALEEFKARWDRLRRVDSRFAT